MQSNDREISCQLSSTQLQQRKTTVLADLKKQIVEYKELPDGYAFAFKGENSIIDHVTEFIKSERQCCSFFTFDLSIKNEQNNFWLSITGPAGSKEFIAAETGLIT